MLSYRLCLALGCLSPDHLVKKLSAKQFLGWQVYDSLEPVGTFYSAGLIAATVANFSMVKKRGVWLTPADFVPKFRTEVKKQSLEQMEAIMMGMVKSGRATKGKKING